MWPQNLMTIQDQDHPFKTDNTQVHVWQWHNANDMCTSNTFQTLCIVVSTQNTANLTVTLQSGTN